MKAKNYSRISLMTEFYKLGYEWSNFHLIGVRSNANIQNKFDDLFIVVNGDNIYCYSSTTNPGTFWLKNLMNPKGAALLKTGQYKDSFKLGLHRGKYQALIQAKPVAVYRDANRDDIAQETKFIESGLFGINIHRASSSTISQLIDKWSAGCQVINNPKDFDAVINECKLSKLKLFTYTLLNEF